MAVYRIIELNHVCDKCDCTYDNLVNLLAIHNGNGLDYLPPGWVRRGWTDMANGDKFSFFCSSCVKKGADNPDDE